MIRIKIHKFIPFVLFFVVIVAFLPYFSQVELPQAQILETVRTLVGSVGLITAVPVTTAIAAGFALYSPRLGKWEPVWGPVGSEEGHHY